MQGKRGRDIISSREKVATSVRGRDNSSEEKRSRQHLVVAAAIQQKGSRDNTWLSRHQLRRLEVATTFACRDNNCTKQKVATTSGYRDIHCKDQKVATSVSCRDVSSNEMRSRQDQDVATPASLKTCRNQTKDSATKTETTEVATRTRCRDSIN